MSANSSVLLTVVGRNFDGLDVDAIATQRGLTRTNINDLGSNVAEVLEAVGEIGGQLFVGSGNQVLDAKSAAALGVPMVVSYDRPGPHVDIYVAESERSGTVVAEACDAERTPAAVAAAQDIEVKPYMSPSVFKHGLAEQARTTGAHIVLPEGEDDRILEAAHEVLESGIARLTILGDPDDIRARAEEKGLDISGADIINHETSELREEFAADFAELRKHKGVTLEQARETMQDISYFATMMVHKGLADGMVSGAAHTTAHTIKPSFQIIKTVPEASVVSSIFLMVMRGRLWAFGDCAVNPNPTAEQLGEIAVVSARTAARFGIDPRVAVLSYSTGASGAGPDVERAVQAVAKARELDGELLVDGPLQFDAAVDKGVAAKKMPDSEVAGQATVFIFPDLEAGNIGYKTAQRTGAALAVGPILQGLNKPVNDLSRGATVADIANTIAVTAIQAGKK
ncbi:phosphate acetyltransferase [Corynebacterium yudongzhengii]|uniref:Phosphate acetyltransferase n=1 Tax=Corynebacterium yudongzhengii TaxID=2080740 RepID=A0A2U1T4W3_9CORY|nr:phosphate acetyltransferase [Corynebacterium yudongzhengii]AWB82682.1 phosphate acetyltransferase [Corynebacterium yudongzhengii]PWC01015.1 phosphate acetyltransferase [Corynebacterium yudongzhengii]